MPPLPAPLTGLVAATFTPMRDDGSIDRDAIAPMVQGLVGHGVAALYVLGSTGEGPSLACDERRFVAEAFVEAAAGRLPVIVQVGSDSLTQSRRLAAHVQEAGADAISAVSPVYFKPDSVATLVASMAEIAAVRRPALLLLSHPCRDRRVVPGPRHPAVVRRANSLLRGIKFTSQNVFEFQSCVEYAADRFEMLWGLDEMLQCGLAAGRAQPWGAPITSRHRSIAGCWAPSRRGTWKPFAWNSLARRQSCATFPPYGPRAAQKAIMSMVGVDCGPSRLPVTPLTSAQAAALQAELDSLGFFSWIEPGLPVGRGDAT